MDHMMPNMASGTTILRVTNLLAVLLVLGGQAATGSELVGVRLSPNGDYEVLVNGELWLRSGPTRINYGGKLYSTADGSLQLIRDAYLEGTDKHGPWSATIWDFLLLGPNIGFQTVIREYREVPMVLFGQVYPDGMNGTSTGDKNKVVSYFPSFKVLDPTTWQAEPLGFLAYGGIMFGDTAKTIGRWLNTFIKFIASGLDSGPLVLFNNRSSAVISPYSQFMALSAVYESGQHGATASWGVMGAVDVIPRGFQCWVSLTASGRGINSAMETWGEIIRHEYNKNSAHRDSDVTVNYLGYWTDNGAYYYDNNTEKDLNYQDTLLDVKHYAAQLAIPYRYVQYDAWFYPLGPKEGTLEWTSLPSVFPKGMQSSKVVYARQNGGSYEFVVEPDTMQALPLEQRFWDDLLAEAKKWGLLVYEQDFMNFVCDEMSRTPTDVHLGRTWLRQMGAAAAKTGLTIQYCMSPSRTSLQSLEIPVVTQARVSDDYQPGGNNWKIGISSMFAHAMGIAPFKDNFWTSTNQSGNPYGKTEPYPALEAVVATLSTGPVGPSDKIGKSDRDLIMRSCNADGLILKPSRPATAIDKQLLETVFRGFVGQVWSTYSMVSGHIFGTIFAAEMGITPMVVSPRDAESGDKFPDSVIFSYRTPTTVSQFSDTKPLTLRGCSKSDFCLFHTTPVLSLGKSTVLLLGDVTKWVPMSPQRVTSITVSQTDITVTLTGAAKERVVFVVLIDNTVYEHLCVLSETGTAELTVARNSCQPF